jgi:hypothetical protein
MKNISRNSQILDYLNPSYLSYSLLFAMVLDLVTILKTSFDIFLYFNDLLVILNSSISKRLNFEYTEQSLLIFLAIFCVTCLLFDLAIVILIKKNRNFFIELAVCILSLYSLLFLIGVSRFPFRIILPVFIILCSLSWVLKKNTTLKSFSTLLGILIIWNIGLMSVNLKEDSKTFEGVFNNNRFFIADINNELTESSIKYWNLNCCSSENYTNSGFKPGSYMGEWRNKIYLVTGSGKFFTVNSNNLSNSIIKLRKIQTNFFDYGNQPEFKSVNKVSIRGIEIYKDLIYVSYIKSNNNCYNLSVLEGVITDNKVVFKPFFSPEECIEILDPNSSQLHSSGGAMLRDENNLYVAIGDFLESTNSQVMDSYYGKILKFGINDEEIEILSSGHRNIQGMTFYNGSILAVEHGPKGGDELNIVDVESRILQNFGWPISSYGEHYDGKFDKDKPLHKSHSKYGFIEPALYFTPSIGISDIKVFSDKYMISSMKSGRLYTLSEDSENNVYNQNYLSIDRRIREIFILDEKLLLFLEDILGLAVLDINK